MPPNTVYVGRPTKWGNPFIPQCYEAWSAGCQRDAIEMAVDDFSQWMRGEEYDLPFQQSVPSVEELRGKDLACWCPLDQPCHADVLLEIANADDKAGA